MKRQLEGERERSTLTGDQGECERMKIETYLFQGEDGIQRERVCLSAEGRTLAAASSSRVEIWMVSVRSLILLVRGGRRRVWLFSSGGLKEETLVMGCGEGSPDRPVSVGGAGDQLLTFSGHPSPASAASPGPDNLDCDLL